ncbi:MAG: PhoU domain-containing protein, partial [Candidatus Bathyarchaeia archaeon]
MEQRKIMSLGRSSLVISLPRYWTQLTGLKAGDIVSVAIGRDRSLIVYPGLKKDRELNEITLYIEPNEDSSFLARKIIACYLNGYSIIKLISKNYFTVTQQRVIRRTAQKMYLRIMEADLKEIRLMTLMDESKGSVKASISRIYNISNSMCRDALVALKGHDAELARSVYLLDSEVDHFTFFLLRILRKASKEPLLANELGLDPVDCLDFQALTYNIEGIADQAATIAKHVIVLGEENKRISEQLVERICSAGHEALSIYEKAFTIFLEGEPKDMAEIIRRRNQLRKIDEEIATLSFSEEKSAETICACCALRDSILRIGDYSVNIAEVAINR